MALPVYGSGKAVHFSSPSRSGRSSIQGKETERLKAIRMPVHFCSEVGLPASGMFLQLQKFWSLPQTHLSIFWRSYRSIALQLEKVRRQNLALND
jgi:hypothetical protein